MGVILETISKKPNMLHLLFFPRALNKATGPGGEREVRSANLRKEKSMGEFGRQSSNTNNDRGVSTKIFKGTNTTFGTPFRDLHLGKNGCSIGRVHSGLARVGSDKGDHNSNVTSFFDNIFQIEEKWEKNDQLSICRL